ncbi:hypothetical protein LY78DRAFT_158069 [Colletotrichum sublineola]|nr:hypothetical protein LY78DRAFT_158069 [Colletotrichum sublineola]
MFPSPRQLHHACCGHRIVRRASSSGEAQPPALLAPAPPLTTVTEPLHTFFFSNFDSCSEDFGRDDFVGRYPSVLPYVAPRFLFSLIFHPSSLIVTLFLFLFFLLLCVFRCHYPSPFFSLPWKPPSTKLHETTKRTKIRD